MSSTHFGFETVDEKDKARPCVACSILWPPNTT